MSKSVDPPESLRLELKLQSTIEFHFGQMCDKVSKLFDPSKDEIRNLIAHAKTGPHDFEDMLVLMVQSYCMEKRNLLKREIRNEGNHAIRVMQNHLKHVRIAHKKPSNEPNLERVKFEHKKGSSHGS